MSREDFWKEPPAWIRFLAGVLATVMALIGAAVTYGLAVLSVKAAWTYMRWLWGLW